MFHPKRTVSWSKGGRRSLERASERTPRDVPKSCTYSTGIEHMHGGCKGERRQCATLLFGGNLMNTVCSERSPNTYGPSVLTPIRLPVRRGWWRSEGGGGDGGGGDGGGGEGGGGDGGGGDGGGDARLQRAGGSIKSGGGGSIRAHPERILMLVSQAVNAAIRGIHSNISGIHGISMYLVPKLDLMKIRDTIYIRNTVSTHH